MAYKDGAIYTILDIFHLKTVFSIAVMLRLSSVASPCFWRTPQHLQHLCLNPVRRSPPILKPWRRLHQKLSDPAQHHLMPPQNAWSMPLPITGMDRANFRTCFAQIRRTCLNRLLQLTTAIMLQPAKLPSRCRSELIEFLPTQNRARN